MSHSASIFSYWNYHRKNFLVSCSIFWKFTNGKYPRLVFVVISVQTVEIISLSCVPMSIIVFQISLSKTILFPILNSKSISGFVYFLLFLIQIQIPFSHHHNLHFNNNLWFYFQPRSLFSVTSLFSSTLYFLISFYCASLYDFRC